MYSIEQRLQEFRDDLPLRSGPEVVQRHITHGNCFALGDNEYFELKRAVGEHFNLHHTEIIVVGSAKLGFSVAPAKRYRPFGDASDIDVALCSSTLYDSMWQDVFAYWARGEEWSHLSDFRKYHFRGWMRPDLLPPQTSFSRANEWWEFFRSLTASGRFGSYKITGALYKEWRFLETYQLTCMQSCKTLEVGQP